VFEYCDIIFGNELEVQKWAKATGQSEINDVLAIAKVLAGLQKINKKRPRMVVITSRTRPTILVSSDDLSNPKSYPITIVEDDKIVDVNGAGDSFAGGFLGALLVGKTPEEAVLYGHQQATAALQQASQIHS
jgi:adenosine kinase